MGANCIRGVEDLEIEDLPSFNRCLREAGDEDSDLPIVIDIADRADLSYGLPERSRTLLDSGGTRIVEKHGTKDPESLSSPAGSAFFKAMRQQAESIAGFPTEASDECEYTGGEQPNLSERRTTSSRKEAALSISPSLTPASEPVVLHVYDLGTSSGPRLLNRLLRPLGTGVFHCGVEIYGSEWSFSDTTTGKGDGIFCGRPMHARGYSYFESIEMGCSRFNFTQVVQFLKAMNEEWPVECYNLLGRNCCHFCNELCLRLGVGPIPAWLVSLADLGARTKDTMCCSTSNTGSLVEEIPVLDVIPVLRRNTSGRMSVSSMDSETWSQTPR